MKPFGHGNGGDRKPEASGSLRRLSLRKAGETDMVILGRFSTICATISRMKATFRNISVHTGVLSNQPSSKVFLVGLFVGQGLKIGQMG